MDEMLYSGLNIILQIRHPTYFKPEKLFTERHLIVLIIHKGLQVTDLQAPPHSAEIPSAEITYLIRFSTE